MVSAKSIKFLTVYVVQYCIEVHVEGGEGRESESEPTNQGSKGRQDSIKNATRLL